jgi:signal transduction histidine kinase
MTFRRKLLAAMMLVVTAITAAGLYFAQHKIASDVQDDLQREFQGELATIHGAQEVRQAALEERCMALVRKPRIHAALEDGALDLLYPSARDEMRDVTQAEGLPSEPSTRFLNARFYRFLDVKGAVISPPDAPEAGELGPDDEAMLKLPGVIGEKQLGYLVRQSKGEASSINEIIVLPITSSETEEPIASLVVGFEPAVLFPNRAGGEIRSGIWMDGRLYLPSLAASSRETLAGVMRRAVADHGGNDVAVDIAGVPHLLFYKCLNPGSIYQPAYEVCIFQLTELLARQEHRRWQIIGIGGVLLLLGLAASHFFSGRLSAPVEQLAVDSAENRAQRVRAEAALQSTGEELQRAARFAADASHQLKTPVTILRAGLEELLARDNLPADEHDEISTLVHQTLRLTGTIDDLLLLSRMEAGRLRLELTPVDLTQLVEAWLDDLSALPDEYGLTVETDVPAGLLIAGEKRYTTQILQNLLVNARKYNCPGGRIRMEAREKNGAVLLLIGNTGRPIPAAAQGTIFERFQRGSGGEDVPGHGLGLNLARELARLHGGDLRLVRSDGTWTEFELRFSPCLPGLHPHS